MSQSQNYQPQETARGNAQATVVQPYSSQLDAPPDVVEPSPGDNTCRVLDHEPRSSPSSQPHSPQHSDMPASCNPPLATSVRTIVTSDTSRLTSNSHGHAVHVLYQAASSSTESLSFGSIDYDEIERAFADMELASSATPALGPDAAPQEPAVSNSSGDTSASSTHQPRGTSASREDTLDGLADVLASVSLGAQHQKSKRETPPISTPLPPLPRAQPQRTQSIRFEEATPAPSSGSSHLAQSAAKQPHGKSDSHQIQAKFKFSPSALAHYAHTSCEKMLHLSGTKALENAQGPKPSKVTTKSGPSTIAEAHMERGIKFEDGIIQSISDRIECDKEKDTDSYFRLATAPIGTTLCQPIFSLDDSFYTPSMRQAGIVFGRFIPDFIRILPGSLAPDGQQKRKLFIIDAKSSAHVKMSHQLQVTLYALFLEHLFKVHHQENLLEIDPQGGVWIPAYKEPCRFPLAFMRPAVREFLYQELPAILFKPLKKAAWHLHDPCNQCEYLERCKSDAKEQKTLSLIPSLSKAHASWIRSLFRDPPSASEIDDIEDLVSRRHELSTDDRITLEKCLRIDINGQSPLLSVYATKGIKVNAKPTLSFPLIHDRRLFINVLMDPLNQLPYAYSIGHYKEQLVDPSKYENGMVAIGVGDERPRRSEFVRLTEELVEVLYEWVIQLANAKIVLPVFFPSQQMRDDLMSLLIRIISKPELTAASLSTVSAALDDDWKSITVRRAMDLLCNFFEDASLLMLPETSRFPIQLPDYLSLGQGDKKPIPSFYRRTFVLDKAVKELTTMPVFGTASFADLKTRLLYHGNSEARAEKSAPDSPSGFYQLWSRGDTAEKVRKSLRTWMDEQNLVSFALYSLLRKECSDLRSILIAPQETFKMRKYFNIESPILARFAFFLTWEIITSVEQKRNRRLGAIKNGDAFKQQQAFRVVFLRRHLGSIPKMNKITDPTSPRSPPSAVKEFNFKEPSNKPFSKFVGQFRVVTPCNSGSFDGGSICKWILSPETDKGNLQRIRYDNMRSVLRSFGRGELPAIASVVGFNPTDMTIYIEGSHDNMIYDLELTEGSTYILEPREFAPTLSTSLSRFVEMRGGGKAFLNILSNPNKWGLVAPEDAHLLLHTTTHSPVRRYDMTPSQEEAFFSVMMNRLRIIWGPPGSGKTFFLASTILRYVDSLIRTASDRRFNSEEVTIILTAFTHSAVDNLVQRIVRLHKSMAPRDGCERFIRPLNIFRIVDSSQEEAYSKIMPPEVQVCDAKKLKTAAKHCEPVNGHLTIRIVAGTVWKIRIASSEKDGAPCMQDVKMLMIDEGSQLLAADALHAIECLDPKNGRLIVAGDHMQLRPVIVGSYPKSTSGVDPTGSIMTNLMRDQNGNPVPDHWMESSASSFPRIGPCTSQLLDNFRMNTQLGEFLQKIYGPNYRVPPAPEKKLPYSSTFDWNLAPELRTVLDPSKSAVCVELSVEGEGRLVNMARTDNRVGAKIEAKMVAGIAEAYLQAVGRATQTSLFIAVPHHVQRLAILQAVSRIEVAAASSNSSSSLSSVVLDDLGGDRLVSLQNLYPNATIKIDTIEKMQGQEADCVIGCFALFDENALLAQLEFLYNVNRWVVGLSRARCKTIVLVSPQVRAPKMILGSSSSYSASSSSSSPLSPSSSSSTTEHGAERSSSRPRASRRSTSQRSVHTDTRPPRPTRPMVENTNGTDQAISISQRPAVRASEEASMGGWSLLRSFESYATSLGAKQTWVFTEEALSHFELDLP